MTVDRDEMLTMLKSGVCTLVFTKVNGEVRKMRCTLVRDLIPTESHPKTLSDDPKESETKPDNTDIIKVYDLDANGWRSFRVSSVSSFNYE